MKPQKPEQDLNELLQPVIALAEDAGRRILEIYKTEFSVEYKADKSPVTDADYAAHNAIQAGLDILTPDIPLLSEESNPDVFEHRRSWGQYWLADPLDGTREFVKRNGNFSVNIALIQNNRPVLGVIHIPVSRVNYFACSNNGAFKIAANQEIPLPIHTRKSTHKPPTIIISRSRRGGRLEKFLLQVGPHEPLRMGSSIKSCMVAEGKADLYPCLGPTSEWDTAAAQCIIEEAGGRLVSTSGEALRYNTKESLINPSFLAYGDPDKDWTRYIQD
jgi:3'(2'), 5'-bisphosphate nucleotidase